MRQARDDGHRPDRREQGDRVQGAVAEAIEPGSSAALLVWENRWAAPFGAAVRHAGGQLVASGRIPIQALLAALEEDEDADGETDDAGGDDDEGAGSGDGGDEAAPPVERSEGA